MGKIMAILVCIAGIILPVLAAGQTHPPPGQQHWATAGGNRNWSFPADHGVHRDFRTEWWYFTGNLAAREGDFHYGYQLTFFRTGLRKTPEIPENPWSVKDLYLAHFALTDVPNGRFTWNERISRTGPGLAGARSGGLDVWLRDWKAVQAEDGIRLQARSGKAAIDLTLVPVKPPVLNGEEGLSLKGPDPGQASWYYSMTSLDTTGTIVLADSTEVNVEGHSWFDHEFGSNQLSGDQAGWDWFGLHLSNGTEVMIYLLRRTDGSFEPASSGTFVGSDGSKKHLSLEDFSVRAEKSWKSPVSGGTYPSGWGISIPELQMQLQVRPFLKNQELSTKHTAGITYWEGAVNITGRTGGKDITGEGYVELTGYAGKMGGMF